MEKLEGKKNQQKECVKNQMPEKGEWDKREVELETWQEKKHPASQQNTDGGDQRRKDAKVLTEAEEKRIHTHGVHAEEAMGDEVGSHYHRLQRSTHTHTHSLLRDSRDDP